MNYSDSALFANSEAYDTNFFKFNDVSGLTSGVTPSSSLDDDATLNRKKESLFLDSDVSQMGNSSFNLIENPDFHKISKSFRNDSGLLSSFNSSRIGARNDGLTSIVTGLPPLNVNGVNSAKTSTGNSPTAASGNQPLYQRGLQGHSRSPSNFSGTDAGDYPRRVSDPEFPRRPSDPDYPRMLQDSSYGYGRTGQLGMPPQQQSYLSQQQQQPLYDNRGYGNSGMQQQAPYGHQGNGMYGAGPYDNEYGQFQKQGMKFSPKVYPNPSPIGPMSGGTPMSASYHSLVSSVEERDKDVYIVEFKKSSKEFVLGYRAPATIAVGDAVIVSADRGEDLGVVTHVLPMKEFLYRKSMMSQPGEFDKSMGRILRLATSSEIMMLSKKVYDENEVIEYCRELVHNVYRLDLHIVDAEYQFDRHKLTIYYEADHRIDFRDLVKALYSTFKARIWMEHAGGGGLM